MIAHYTSESTAEHYAARQSVMENREYVVQQTGTRQWSICPVEPITAETTPQTCTLDVLV